MKTRKKTEAEMKADADLLHTALGKCGEACKAFRSAFFDFEMDVGEMPLSLFLAIHHGAVEYRYAMMRAAQPKVGEKWEKEVTHKSNYEEE